MLLYKNYIPKFQAGSSFNSRVNTFEYTQEDRDNSPFFNENMIKDLQHNCKGDACLLYTKGLGYIPGVKTIADIENARGILSTSTTPTPEQIAKYPYLRGDTRMGSVDSWDAAGVFADSGITYFNSLKDDPEKFNDAATPVGTFYLWGPEGRDSHPEGYSKDKGYNNSNHTMIKVGWDKDTGESVLLDGYSQKLYTLSQAKKAWSNYSLQTAIAPSENENLNKEFFQNYLTSAPVISSTENLPNSYDRLKNNLEFLSGVKGKKVGSEFLNIDLQNFSKAMVDNAGSLSSTLGIDRNKYIKMMNFLIATAMSESKGGKSLKGLKGNLSEFLGSTIGLTQLNPDNIFNDPQLAVVAAKYGIESESDIKDPYKAGIASIIYLSQLDKTSERLYNKGNENPRLIKSKRDPNAFTSPWESAKLAVKREFRGTKYKPDEYRNGYYVLPNGKSVKLNYATDELNEKALKAAVEQYMPGQSNLYSYKNGEVYRQATGNVELTPEERWSTAWRSPGVLLKGDATKNKYVQKTMYNLNNYIRSAGALNNFYNQ